METGNESRRDFLAGTSRMVIAAGLATVVGGRTQVSAKDKKPTLGKSSLTLRVDTSDPANSALKSNGKAIFIEDPYNKERPIIVYRKGANEVTAFSSKCTHKGGPVGLPGDDGLAVCGFHKAAFNNSGEVMKGPAKDHLKSFNASISDGIILINI